MKRGHSVHDLQSDFSDGTLLIQLLEILSERKLPRYTKQPRFLSQKIDNISIALKFMEDVMDIKVVGCTPQAIAHGNITQVSIIHSILIAVDPRNHILSDSKS